MTRFLAFLLLAFAALAADSYYPGQLPRVSDTSLDAQLISYQDSKLKLFSAEGYGLNLLTMPNATAARSVLGLAIGSDVQAFDADLAVIAGLDTSAFGRNWLTNNSATVARGNLDAQQLDADLTAIAALDTASFGREILTNSSALLARSYLGLTIGTHVQPYSAELVAIGALNTSAYGRSFLTLSSANAGRGYLELGITNSPQFASPYFNTSLELGHATDTTLARSSAGRITVESVPVALQPSTETITASAGTLTITAGKGPNQSSRWFADGDVTLAWVSLADNDSGRLRVWPAATNVTITLPVIAGGPNGTTLTVMGGTGYTNWTEIVWVNGVEDSTNRVSINALNYYR